jgi:hypothetical protein
MYHYRQLYTLETAERKRPPARWFSLDSEAWLSSDRLQSTGPKRSSGRAWVYEVSCDFHDRRSLTNDELTKPVSDNCDSPTRNTSFWRLHLPCRIGSEIRTTDHNFFLHYLNVLGRVTLAVLKHFWKHVSQISEGLLHPSAPPITFTAVLGFMSLFLRNKFCINVQDDIEFSMLPVT